MNKNVIMSFLTGSDGACYSFAASCIKYGIEKEVYSNHIKYSIYSAAWPMAFRPKRTGFEKIVALDTIARKKIKDTLPDNVLNKDKHETSDSIIKKFINSEGLNQAEFEEYISNYKKQLIDLANQYRGQDNILYLSGGIDSELMCNAFIDANVPFVPVIFTLTNSTGEAINDFDTEWAFKFCKEKNITPVVRFLDVETFWNSKELLEIAQEHNYYSPQHCTHYKMIDMINKEIELHGRNSIFLDK